MRKWVLPTVVLLVLLLSSPALARGGGGCFHPESRILKSDGTEVPISALRRGDELLAFLPEGRLVPTKVRNVVRHWVDEYILLKTDGQTVRVTEEHPLRKRDNIYSPALSIKVEKLIGVGGISV